MSENKIMENETQQEDFIMHPTVDFCFKELMANPGSQERIYRSSFWNRS